MRNTQNVFGGLPARAGLLIGVITLMLTGSSIGLAANISVGSGCDHESIAAAVFQAFLTAGDDVIRITENLTNQSVVLDDFKPSVRGKVTIRGGYTSCLDTSASGRTIVDGVTSNPVFRVQTTNESESLVILENLQVKNAQRGVEVLAGGKLTLKNVVVLDNPMGGANVVSGNLTVDQNSSIEFNGSFASPPPFGGGIACNGGYIAIHGRVYNNRAELGGGIAMESGCTVELGPGSYVALNDASSNGGGLYVSTGSVVVGSGNGAAIQISSNYSNRGGGIYLADGTAVFTDTSFETNRAEVEGGAIYATASSLFHMAVGSGCSTGFACNQIKDNYLGTPGDGSVLHNNNSQVTLLRQRVAENQAEPLIALNSSLMFVTGDDASLTLENLEIWGNVATSLVDAQGGATVVGGYLSAAQNTYDVQGSPVPSRILTSGTGTQAGYYSSILRDGKFAFGTGSPQLTLDCLIVASMVGVPPGSQAIVEVDPQFVDQLGGDLHVGPTSPAVDFCDEAVYPLPGAPDFDGQIRGFDNPLNPNGAPGIAGGVYDVGIDEVLATTETPLFADGFESGNTSAWSSAN